MERQVGRFIWDADREGANVAKHGIDFITAMKVFLDASRKIIIDSKHSILETRYYCIGKVDGRIITVRFTPPPQSPALKGGDTRGGISHKRRMEAPGFSPESFTY